MRYNSITNRESDSKTKNDDNKNFEKGGYRDVRGSLCSELPRPITRNRTPPPHSQPNKNLTLNKTIFAIVQITIKIINNYENN